MLPTMHSCLTKEMLMARMLTLIQAVKARMATTKLPGPDPPWIACNEPRVPALKVNWKKRQNTSSARSRRIAPQRVLGAGGAEAGATDAGRWSATCTRATPLMTSRLQLLRLQLGRGMTAASLQKPRQQQRRCSGVLMPSKPPLERPGRRPVTCSTSQSPCPKMWLRGCGPWSASCRGPRRLTMACSKLLPMPAIPQLWKPDRLQALGGEGFCGSVCASCARRR